MEYLHQFLVIASVHLLALMSPGPDFVMIVKNSLVYSKRSGVITALGLALGICVHIGYSLLGIGLLISRSIVLFSLIKFIGAGYLVFIGYKSLRAKAPEAHVESSFPANLQITTFAAIKKGFLTNVFNPKVTLFFLAIFTQVIDPKTPLYIQLAMSLEMALMTFAWFAFVATVLSAPKIKLRFQKVQSKIEKFTGGVLILFGIKLALTKAR